MIQNHSGLLRTKLFGCPELPTIIFTGRLTHKKELMLLLEAVCQLKHSGLIFNVLFVGDGPEKVNLEKQSHEFGLEVLLFFTGLIIAKKNLAL